MILENLCGGNNAYGNMNYHKLPMNSIVNLSVDHSGGKNNS